MSTRLSLRSTTAALVMSGAMVLGATAASAADTSQTDKASFDLAQSSDDSMQNNMQEGGSVDDYSDEQLQNYVLAMQDVSAIGQEKEPEIANAESEDEAQQIWQEAQEEMASAVEDRGLTVEEYNEITQAAQSDPELASKLNSMVESQ
ncbi:MAG: DUF4168 domain-containing protein [Pseudomonadota bacterium]|uniref:DUF4168 domain-containing protein n=1 Tax=Fodinicurvata fenggangensis TaxID=1121830 RepID=UPI0012DC938F|nr:DUF4168 domain-containing protein [Fodinicurvata fenggangensis]